MSTPSSPGGGLEDALAKLTARENREYKEPLIDARPPPTGPDLPSSTRQVEIGDFAIPKEGATTDPSLEIKCGPLLRYSTLTSSESAVSWTGSILLVTKDASSKYEPRAPFVTLWYDIYDYHHNSTAAPGTAVTTDDAVPADSGRPVSFRVPGQAIINYKEHTFWRFPLSIPITKQTGDMQVRYSVNGGSVIEFYIAGKDDGWRWCFHSCNGFSSNVNEEEFNGTDPLWNDLLTAHSHHRLHALVGGGDQLYCDRVTATAEPIQQWLDLHTVKERANATFTPAMQEALDDFYFGHYCMWFSKGLIAQAFACIPTVNMCDDHDLIDGFGSYPDEWMSTPVFRNIGSTAFKWYLLFQNHKPFINLDEPFDYKNHQDPTDSSFILGSSPPPYIPYRSHTILTFFGPRTALLALDTRAERTKTQIVSQETYATVFNELRMSLPPTIKQLVVLLGVPIAYPRMNFIENYLENGLNALSIFGKALPGTSKVLNRFNKEPEILDDLNDHWTAKGHKAERNWLIEQFQNFATEKQIRVSFVSGDVHCASVGRFYTPDARPSYDPRFMLQIVSSAIVNTPPPGAVLGLVAGRAEGTKHKLKHLDTVEDMLPVFAHDPTGPSIGNHYYIHDEINKRPGSDTSIRPHLPRRLHSAFPNPKLMALGARAAGEEDPESEQAQDEHLKKEAQSPTKPSHIRKASEVSTTSAKSATSRKSWRSGKSNDGEVKPLTGQARFVVGQRNYCLIREIEAEEHPTGHVDGVAKKKASGSSSSSSESDAEPAESKDGDEPAEIKLKGHGRGNSITAVVSPRKNRHPTKFPTLPSTKGNFIFMPENISQSKNVGLEFVLRVERGRGAGTTEGYSVTTPPLLRVGVELGNH